MGEVFAAAQLEWELVRPDVAHGVYGKTLLANGIKLVLTRVAAGGKCDVHRDSYSHPFYFQDTYRINISKYLVRLFKSHPLRPGYVNLE